MISSIFGKTKPINYIIVLVFLFLFYWFVHLILFKNIYNPEQLPLQIGILGILLLSILAVNFIVTRNKVSGANSFAILLYALLIVLFPETITDGRAVLCSFFILLAIRRIISLKSLKDIKFKILDATLWVLCASLCYDWAILFLILIFVAIYFYEPKNIRNWIVPLIGVLTFVLLLVGFLMLTNNLSFVKKHYEFSFNFEDAYFLDFANSTKLGAYVLVTTIMGIIAFLKIVKLGVGRIITLRLIAVAYCIGITLKFLITGEHVYPIIITFFPAVIFMNNYVETIEKPKLKELVLFVCVLIPFMVLMFTSFF